MMNVPRGVMSGKSPMKTSCSLISPVSRLMKRISTNSGAGRRRPSPCTRPRCTSLAELVAAELHAHVLGVVLDGADILERLRQALALEKLKAVRLDGDEVGDVHDVRNLRKAAPIPVKAGLISRFSLSHEAFPPSCAPAFLRKSRNCLRYVESQGESRKIFTNCGNSLLICPFIWENASMVSGRSRHRDGIFGRFEAPPTLCELDSFAGSRPLRRIPSWKAPQKVADLAKR